MNASTQGMRCKGMRAMWQGERMQWQGRVIDQGEHDNNRGDMECEWRIDVGR
jgi:hypothetical protein